MEQALNDFRGNQIDGAQYSQISQAAIAKKQEAQTAAQPIVVPTVELVDKVKPQTTKSRYPRIDTTFQTMLGVNPDGSLGPLTQSALEMYKKSIGLPYGADEATRKTDSNKNNQQAFESLKKRPEYKARKPMVYDDTNDVYQAPPGGIVRESPF